MGKNTPYYMCNSRKISENNKPGARNLNFDNHDDYFIIIVIIILTLHWHPFDVINRKLQYNQMGSNIRI